MDCPFCTLPSSDPARVVAHNALALALSDGFPVSPGHTLVVPRRHVASWFDATAEERAAILALVDQVRDLLDARLHPAGYNLGINDGLAAGQTVPHLHVHVIPRFDGDVDDPTGGVRFVIPERGNYRRPGFVPKAKGSSAVPANADRDLIVFAEQLMLLLDQGSFVATYKYAVLLGLMDLCLEKTQRDGTAPTSVTTRELARKVIELYWPHTEEFARGGTVLRQNSGRQARILADIDAFRGRQPDRSVTLDRARLADPAGFERLLRDVEWTLILMPLPRLQVIGRTLDPFVYRIGWDLGIERRRCDVVRYQRGDVHAFDNLIRFQDGVGDHMVRLSGLLRPLIHRGWAGMVARFNALPEAALERFLFGVDRSSLDAVRAPLLDVQEGRCFYCGARVATGAEVDHFIPWARRPDNGLHNLVVADRRCNGAKRDFLAAPRHAAAWVQRNDRRARDLDALAAALCWEANLDRTMGTARGIYLRLGAGTRLWVSGGEFVAAEPEALRGVFG